MFTIPYGIDQGIDDLGIGCQPVTGDLDSGDIGVYGGLPQHVDHRVEGVIGEV